MFQAHLMLCVEESCFRHIICKASATSFLLSVFGIVFMLVVAYELNHIFKK